MARVALCVLMAPWRRRKTQKYQKRRSGQQRHFCWKFLRCFWKIKPWFFVFFLQGETFFGGLFSVARCPSVLLGAPRCSLVWRCSVLLGVPRCCSVFLGVARCCSVFLGVPRCCAVWMCSVLLGVPRCCSVFLGVLQCCSVLLGVPRCSSVLRSLDVLGVTRCSSVLLGVAQCSPVLLGVPRFSSVFLGWMCSVFLGVARCSSVLLLVCVFGSHPQYGWEFADEMEQLQKDVWNVRNDIFGIFTVFSVATAPSKCKEPYVPSRSSEIDWGRFCLVIWGDARDKFRH